MFYQNVLKIKKMSVIVMPWHENLLMVTAPTENKTMKRKTMTYYMFLNKTFIKSLLIPVLAIYTVASAHSSSSLNFSINAFHEFCSFPHRAQLSLATSSLSSFSLSDFKWSILNIYCFFIL